MKGCKKAFAFVGLLGLGLLIAPAAMAADPVHDATAKARGNMNLALGQAGGTAYRSYSVAPSTNWAAPAAAPSAATRSYSYAPSAQYAPVYATPVAGTAPHSLGFHDAGAKVRGTFGL
jgi:hypothetical protein